MDIQIPQILFQVVNFGVVAAALTYLLYNPIQKVLDERTNRINAAQKAAEESLKEKEQLVKTKEQSAKEARMEAAKIIEDAKKKAQKQKEDLLEQAHQQVEQTTTKAKAGWEREKQKLALEMKREFADTVLLVAEKVIGKLDKKTHVKLIDTEIKSIMGQLSN